MLGVDAIQPLINMARYGGELLFFKGAPNEIRIQSLSDDVKEAMFDLDNEISRTNGLLM